MTIDPRTPAIVGVGQATWRPDGSAEPLGDDAMAPEPLDMWETVLRRALDDSGAPSLVDRVDDLRVVYCQSWPYDDPAGRVAERIGASPKRLRYTGIGGTTPLVELADACRTIGRNEADVVVIVSGEALATKRRLKKLGERPAWSHRHPDKQSMPFEAPFHDAEVAHEVFQAWLTFALWDVARRADRGISPTDYTAQLAATMSALSRRAEGNPYAWFPSAVDADTLATPTPDNRLVGSPYTKRMVSVMDVDMAAALVVTSSELADAVGVTHDRRVHLAGYAYGCDPVYVAEHPVTAASPAMAAVFGQALGQAGRGIDDIAHLDLYSCFASSVNFAADALGISPTDPRGLTITGGLPYFGGVGSGYLTHSIAAMVERLRADPDAAGLVSGVGMHMTKHAAGVLTATPVGPTEPHDADVFQKAIDAANPARTLTHTAAGPATVVTASVVHGRDGEPEWALLVCDLPDGTRAYAKVLDTDLLVGFRDEECVGRSVTLATVDGPMGPMNVAT